MTPRLLDDVKFLTIYEVAVIVRLSKMSVYRLVHSGELEAVRVGRSFRVPEQAVVSYLRGAAYAPSPTQADTWT
jgi:excisionase family DNA binding protein